MAKRVHSREVVVKSAMRDLNAQWLHNLVKPAVRLELAAAGLPAGLYELQIDTSQTKPGEDHLRFEINIQARKLPEEPK